MMSVLRRPVLLLSAAVSITVPSLLAAVAVLGHEHAVNAAGARAQAASLGVGAAKLAGAADTAGAPHAGDMLPAVPAGGAQKPTASLVARASAEAIAAERQAQGMAMLRQAAAAGLGTSYRGVEMVAQWTVAGKATVVSKVWHRGGGQTVTVTSDAASPASSQASVDYDVDNRAPEGVFGVTTTLVTLLAEHYTAQYNGTGSVAGRQALIVQVLRGDGSLAAQFWLDKQTMVPLRKDVYDSHAAVVSDDRFVTVVFGRQALSPIMESPAGVPAQPTWTAAPAPAVLVRQLNGAGWRLPAMLPGGLNLYSAAQTTTPSGKVVNLGYSDGLSVVSLFVQRGTLPAKMPGWQTARVAGRQVYVAQHEITLSGQGFVYTLIADALPQTVDAAVAALPQSGGPGFLGRIGRGLGRLVAEVDPFK